MLELTITIDYTDDFNQPRSLTQTLTVGVTEASMMPTPDLSAPSDGGVVTPGAPQTFWQKLWRFILGLLGLESGVPVDNTSSPVLPTTVPVLPFGGGGGGGKG